MADMFTIGHGRLDRDGLIDQLHGAGVRSLVDIRRFPGSRNNPDVGREALESWLPDAGVAYRWDERLGGRRNSMQAANWSTRGGESKHSLPTRLIRERPSSLRLSKN